jgi:hypothetical protein
MYKVFAMQNERGHFSKKLLNNLNKISPVERGIFIRKAVFGGSADAFITPLIPLM